MGVKVNNWINMKVVGRGFIPKVVRKVVYKPYHNSVNPTISGLELRSARLAVFLPQFLIHSGGLNGVSDLDPRYDHLEHYSKHRAYTYFQTMKSNQPHLAWMERIFLEILDLIAKNKILAKVPANQIKSIDPNDPRYFEKYENIVEKEESLRDLGREVIRKGELMAIDLVAGMATGFGGTAKGAVQAHLDARYDYEKGITYLDIKRRNYLALQKMCKRHLIAAAMVSDETEPHVIESLRNFAKDNKVEPVFIRDGESRENVKKIFDKYKDKWASSIIIPIIRQPSTLYISQDGKYIGDTYMKGHGDFYEVVKSQLKDIIGIAGIKYIFSSNIDNTGAWISSSILGYFVERVQQEGIEAIVEMAEKFEGDKGGAPALINNVLTVLEEAFVPDEWKDQFLDRKVFPYMNTNTFWFSAQALLNKDFSLPLMISKKEKKGDQIFLKVESIMAHGLEQLKWKALVVNRGLRFIPEKYLTDLWIGRTDWKKWYKGLLMPVMREGEYVPKPQVEISKNIFGLVADLNRRIFGYGAYDSMKFLKTLIIGGEGEHFNELGDYTTKCGVCYEGDVVIIFEHKERVATGTLVIQGKSESDEITLKDCVIFVPAGEVKKITKSVLGGPVDPHISREKLEKFLFNAKRWPASQRRRVLEKFFLSEKIEFQPTPIQQAASNYTPTSDFLRILQAVGVKIYEHNGMPHTTKLLSKIDPEVVAWLIERVAAEEKRTRTKITGLYIDPAIKTTQQLMTAKAVIMYGETLDFIPWEKEEKDSEIIRLLEEEEIYEQEMCKKLVKKFLREIPRAHYDSSSPERLKGQIMSIIKLAIEYQKNPELLALVRNPKGVSYTEIMIIGPRLPELLTRSERLIKKFDQRAQEWSLLDSEKVILNDQETALVIFEVQKSEGGPFSPGEIDHIIKLFTSTKIRFIKDV